MNIEQIKQVIELIKENDLAEFEVEDQGFRLSLKRRSAPDLSVVAVAPAPVAPANLPDTSTSTAPPSVAAPAGPAIKSPIVGTFYRSASPDAESLVSVGQAVDEETVVAIIEAMKVMNEIKAEMCGKIRKVCVENATAVQYGQVLFELDPL